jgi:RNA polymerase sigma factor (TIGR02999 family)
MQSSREGKMVNSISWDDLYPFMDEVKAMAQALLSKEGKAGPLQPTALVLTALRRQRRVDQEWSEVTWADRQQFFSRVYRTMRQALVDHARRRSAQKRHIETLISPEVLQRLDVKELLEQQSAMVVTLEETLAWLEAKEPQWVEVIEHKFYGGLTTREIARVMELSVSTVERIWRRARLVLAEDITRRFAD